MTREEARQLRKLLENETETMPDEKIAGFPAFVEKWKPGKEYKTGKRLAHEGTVYKTLQDHTSQKGWEPDAAPSLFAKVLIPTDDEGQQTEIPEWEQPDSTNPYMQGDRVTHGGKTWESNIDNNVWEPGVYGWHEVT